MKFKLYDFGMEGQHLDHLYKLNYSLIINRATILSPTNMNSILYAKIDYDLLMCLTTGNGFT